jgi:hypothetical protein
MRRRRRLRSLGPSQEERRDVRRHFITRKLLHAAVDPTPVHRHCIDTAATHATCPPSLPNHWRPGSRLCGSVRASWENRQDWRSYTATTVASCSGRYASSLWVCCRQCVSAQSHSVRFSAQFNFVSVLRGRREGEVSIDRCLPRLVSCTFSPVSLRLTRLTSTATAVNDWTRDATCASVITLLLQDSVVTSSAASDGWAAEGGIMPQLMPYHRGTLFGLHSGRLVCLSRESLLGLWKGPKQLHLGHPKIDVVYIEEQLRTWRASQQALKLHPQTVDLACTPRLL